MSKKLSILGLLCATAVGLSPVLSHAQNTVSAGGTATYQIEESKAVPFLSMQFSTLMAQIDRLSDAQLTNPKITDPLLEQFVLKHIDVQKFAQTAAGLSYRSATAEERKQYQAQVRTLLKNTFTSALLQAKGTKIDFKPVRNEDPAGTKVSAKVVSGTGAVFSLGFDMQKKGANWIIQDVTIEDLSLVGSFREQFKMFSAQGGLPAVTQALRQLNSGKMEN